MKKINIAIDGHSGCGKSSTAKAVAKTLDYKYIDTGAMYRAVTWALISTGTSVENKIKLTSVLDNLSIDFKNDEQYNSYQTILNGKPVEKEIRTMDVAKRVSPVSAEPLVREKMLVLQQQMALQKGVVMDGRDIGTVVLPGAELKIFMTADPLIRAKRRKLELENSGQKDISEQEVISNLLERDKTDSERKISPLRKADDAILIDTTSLSFDQQVRQVLDLALQKIKDHAGKNEST